MRLLPSSRRGDASSNKTKILQKQQKQQVIAVKTNNNNNNNHGSGFPDLHLKMCKKVAQLTRVIYHLNTQNENYEAAIRDMNKQHNHEIDSILNDASRKIEAFKQKLEQQRDVKQIAKLKEQQELKHATERKVAHDRLVALREDVEAREKRLHRDYAAKLVGVERELSNLRQNFDSRVAQSNVEIEKLKAEIQNLSGSADGLKGAHKNEVADLVRETNQKYNEMLTSRLESEERLRDEMQQQANEFIATLESERKAASAREQELNETAAKDQASMLHSQQVLADEELKQREDKLLALIKQEQQGAESIQMRMDEAMLDLEVSSRSIKEQREIVSQLNTRARSDRANIDSLTRQVAKVQESAEKAKRDLIAQAERFNGNVADLGDKLSTRDKEIRDACTARDDLLSQLERERASKETKLTNAQVELSLIASKLEASHIRNRELQSIVDELQSSTSSRVKKEEESKTVHAQALSIANKTAQNLKRQLGELSKTHETAINEYVKRLETAEATCKTAQMETIKVIKEAKDEVGAVEMSHKQALDALDRALEEEKLNSVNIIQQVKLQAEHELEKITSLHQEALQQVESEVAERNKEIAQVKTVLALETESSLASQAELLHANEIRLEGELKTAVAEAIHNKTLFTQSKDQLCELDDQLNEAKRVIEEHEERMRQEAKCIVALESQIGELRVNGTEAQKQTEIRLLAVRREAEAETQTSVRIAVAAATATMMKQADVIKVKYEKDIVSLRDELSVERRKLEEIRGRLSETAGTIERRERELSEERERAVTRTKENVAQEIKKIEEKHAIDIKTLQEETERLQKLHILKASESAEQALVTEIETLNDKHEKEMDVMRCDLMNRATKLENELKSRAQRDVREAEEKAVQDVAEIRELAHENATRHAEDVKRQLDRLSSDLRLRERMCEELKGTIQEQNFKFEQKLRNHQEEIAKAKQISEEVHVELDHRYMEEMAALRADMNVAQIQYVKKLAHEFLNKESDLRAKFNEAIQEREKRYEELNERYDKLRGKFDLRVSRTEDVQRIRDLSRTVAQSNADLMDMKENMKTLKMELMNREETFNKVFNRIPNVGVMQVIKPNASGGKGPKKGGNSGGKRRQNQRLIEDVTGLPPVHRRRTIDMVPQRPQQQQYLDEYAGGGRLAFGDMNNNNVADAIHQQSPMLKRVLY